MRVKVGNNWYKVELEQPIMVELTKQDKENISNMLPTATKYATFEEGTMLTEQNKIDWMKT